MSKKYCYLFTEGNAKMRELLGGKGANLAEMTNIGLPVPQGFTITTEACTQYYEDGRQLNQRDQDVLLKVVEEGPPYAAFIFCADAPAALLETVRSRCTLLKYDGEDAPLSDGTAELCRAFASGRLLPVTTALLSREQSLKRETLQAQLEELWRAAAEALLVQQGKARPDPSCAEAALLLADRLTARQLLGLCAASQRFAEQCDQNAGVGQILGALAVKWEELL